MRNWNLSLPIMMLAIALGACGGRPAKVDLGVDLYLHPDSAAPADVMLQAAIQDRIRNDETLRRDLIHVRVYQLNVFLSGSVKDPCAVRKAAEDIANSTTVEVTGGTAPIKPAHVENHIQGMDNQPCQS